MAKLSNGRSFKSSVPTVSIVICCYNSAERIVPTLKHLLAQKVANHTAWEVVLVDNGSSDSTVPTALSTWSSEFPAQLRIVREPRLGLNWARLTGFRESAGDVVSLIDDDNWVCMDWVQRVSDCFATAPNVAMLGSNNEAECEVEPPPWFKDFHGCYAIGGQGRMSGDVTLERPFFFGAGISVRKVAWDALVNYGFAFHTSDRSAGRLGSGGDTELCYALKLAGWRMCYDSELRLKHFVPRQRLIWSYLRRLNRGFGEAAVLLVPYHVALETAFSTETGDCTPNWRRTLLYESKELLKLYLACRLRGHFQSEGSRTVIEYERKLGKVLTLLKWRSGHDRAISEISTAPWRHHGPGAMVN